MLTPEQIERERVVLERLCVQHPVEMVYVDQICRQAQLVASLIVACRQTDRHVWDALGGDEDPFNKERAERVLAALREAIAKVPSS